MTQGMKGIRKAAAIVLTAFAMFGAAQAAAYQTEFRALRAEQRFDEAVALLESHLERDAQDHEARTDLTLTLFRMRQNEYALQQTDLLLRSESAEARRRGEMLRLLHAKLTREEQGRKELSDALAALDAGRARKTVEDMDLAAEQRAILRMYVEMYAGDFAAARSALAVFQPKRLSDRKKIQAMAAEIDAAEAKFVELLSKVEAFWYSGDSVSTFSQHAAQHVPAIRDFSIQAYLEATAALAEHAPLNARAMDAMVHSAMLLAPEEEFLGVARKVLRQKGAIRIPCFSRTQHFDLVIDSEERRLRTEAVNRPFVATHTAKGQKAPFNDWYLEVVPFDVPFSAMGPFKQMTKHNFSLGGLDNEGYVLKLKTGGVVPAYALMPALHLSGGEKAQKTATRNLGRLVEEAAREAGAPLNAELVDPNKATVNKKMVFAAVLSGLSGAVGAHAAQNGDFATAMQLQQNSSLLNMLIVDDANRDARLARNQIAWNEHLAQRGFEFVRDYEFGEIEALLGVQ